MPSEVWRLNEVCKLSPLIGFTSCHPSSPVGRGRWSHISVLLSLLCSVLMTHIIHLNLFVATWIVPVLGINANMLTSGSFHIGQTLQLDKVPVSKFHFLSYLGFINDIALALSVPDFHCTHPCLPL